MKQKFYGITVMLLLSLAVIIASLVIFTKSTILGFIYMGILFLGFFAILYAFCAKCAIQEYCPHILPGKIAMLFKRQTNAYTKTEITVVIISFLLLVGIPQFWLRYHIIHLIVFWFLIIASLLLMPVFLCPYCNNQYCPLKTKKN